MFYRCCLIQWLHNDNYTSNNMSKDRAVKRKFINIPNKKKKKINNGNCFNGCNNYFCDCVQAFFLVLANKDCKLNQVHPSNIIIVIFLLDTGSSYDL